MPQTPYDTTTGRSSETIPPVAGSPQVPTNPEPANAEAGTNTELEQPTVAGGSESSQQQADRAREQLNELTQQAAEAGEEIKQNAIEASNRAKQAGRQYADEKKAFVADEIGVFSGAIRKAAKTLHQEQHDSIASYVDAVAEQLDHARHSLQSKDLDELFDDVQQFARRRPEVVYGGLFITGLAEMRFLKASKPKPRRGRRPDPPDRDLSVDTERPPTAFGHPPETEGTLAEGTPASAEFQSEPPDTDPQGNPS